MRRAIQYSKHSPFSAVVRTLFGAAALLALLALAACSPGVPGGGPTGEGLRTEAALPASLLNPTPDPLRPPSDQVTPPVVITGQVVLPEALEASNLGATLLNAEVLGEAGQKIAGVTGIVVDVLSGQAQYLALQTTSEDDSRQILLPWSAFQLTLVPAPNSSASRTTEVPAIRLSVSDQDMASAPALAEILRAEMPAGWDQAIRAYWEGKGTSLPVTGPTQGADRPSAFINFLASAAERSSYPVADSQGQLLGSIEDLIIRPDASLAFGLFRPDPALDLADVLLPVSWQVLAWDEQQARFLLNASVDVLRSVPQFDSAHLPDMTVPGWDQDWQRFWDTNGGPQPAASPNQAGAATPAGQEEGPRLFSTLVGRTVVDRTGQAQGELVDWLLDKNGAPHYMVVQMAQRFVPLPWSTLTAPQPGAEDSFLFNLDPAVLAQAPAFDRLELVTEYTGWYAEAVEYWKRYVRVTAPQPGTPTPDTEPRLVSALGLVKSTAVAFDQAALGPVRDLILAPDGVAQYVVITLNDRFYPVPWEMFEYNLDKGNLVYLDDRQRLDEAPAFNAISDIDLSVSRWDQAIRTHWGMK